MYQPTLDLDWSEVPVLTLNAVECLTTAEMAPTVDGKVDLTKMSEISLQELGQKFRFQKIVFESARDIYEQMTPNWSGAKDALLIQLIRLVDTFIRSDKLEINPPLFFQDEMRRRVLLTLSMNRIVQHFWEAIRFQKSESLTPVFDPEKPIRSTSDMRPWFTGKPCGPTELSHINQCVYDSTWEASDAYRLDHSDRVDAWVKNDHLGFEIWYVFRGVRRRFYPDFLVRLKNGVMLVLETKGEDDEQNRAKRKFLGEWISAVNAQGSFGRWSHAVALNPGKTEAALTAASLA